MSAYSTVETQFTDPELLIAALRELGYNPVVSLEKPSPLMGYDGTYRTLDGEGHTRNASEAMCAHIKLTRAEVGGASNEIGFLRGTDGTFRLIVSAFDSGAHWTVSRTQKLAGVYADCKVNREAKKAGFRVAGRKVVNNQIQYQFVKA